MRISDWSSDVCSSDLLCSLPAARSTDTVLSVAGTICEATARFQTSSYRRRSSSLRKRATCAGVRSAEVGRTASWASCAFLDLRSEEHTSELQSLMRISYAVFCLKKKKKNKTRQKYS